MMNQGEGEYKGSGVSRCSCSLPFLSPLVFAHICGLSGCKNISLAFLNKKTAGSVKGQGGVRWDISEGHNDVLVCNSEQHPPPIPRVTFSL